MSLPNFTKEELENIPEFVPANVVIGRKERGCFLIASSYLECIEKSLYALVNSIDLKHHFIHLLCRTLHQKVTATSVFLVEYQGNDYCDRVEDQLAKIETDYFEIQETIDFSNVVRKFYC
ncbi:unnamed protein product [Caenorhabditis angaria]|uniref:Uncharacterized protein n=1 Tax=Caenorhabditis angaria TaxID=860376 RepID=A0A9P1J4E5_9PELO|nr:unnamed protein product [Caenorhabditis angaria]